MRASVRRWAGNSTRIWTVGIAEFSVLTSIMQPASNLEPCTLNLRKPMLLRMKLMDRRRFVIASAAAAATLKSLGQTASSAATPTVISPTLHPDHPGPAIPPNFIGLSCTRRSNSPSRLLLPANHGLIAQFRALAPHGVLRIGGNTSDVGWWKPTPDSTKPPLPANVVLQIPAGEKSPEDLAYAITPEAVRNLRGFLDATGWTCLYGINLGTNTPALAADQAVFAAKTLYPKLEYFQLGNEPDGFPRRFREKAKWNADAYLDDWLPVANAIRARVPDARFGLPDVAGNVGWFAPIADRLAALAPADSPRIAALTHHYYFTGPPSNPKATIANLLQTDAKVDHNGQLAQAAAAKLHTHYRMTEGNTCYRGGKPGLSDVFAASLWAADYLLTLAALGYAGVNLHGGEGKMVADSLGGTLPGELLMPDPTVPHPRPFYTPIADIGSAYVAERVLRHALCAAVCRGNADGFGLHPGEVNATAYAAKFADGRTLVAVINKDASKDLELALPGFGVAERLTAESLTSTNVKFDPVPAPSRNMTIPAASAAILHRTT